MVASVIFINNYRVKRVPLCNQQNLPHLLMSFQLMVGLLLDVGTGRGSPPASRPLMKHGSVSRQHSPSALSARGAQMFTNAV